MWIVLVIILLLIWGNISRKSPNHPLNRVCRNPLTPICSTKDTVGDNFGSGCTFVMGVPEPFTALTCNAPSVTNQRTTSGASCQHIVVHFPVDPPPIAIQRPKNITPSPAQILPAFHCNVRRRTIPVSCYASAVCHPVAKGVFSCATPVCGATCGCSLQPSGHCLVRRVIFQ